VRAAPASAWTPAFPADKPLPPRTTNEQFWGILLERLCTDSAGHLRTDRGSVCKNDANGGTLPVEPKNAASRVAALFDDAMTNSARVKQEQTKTVPLGHITRKNLLSVLQPANDSSPGTQGTPAQTDAVTSIQPVAQTGTSAAIAGTPAGPRIVASVAVNPAGMFTTSTGDAVLQRTGTKAMRLADLSLVVPVNPAGGMAGTGTLGAFDYVGVRLRMNATPLIDDKLYDEALVTLAKALRGVADVENLASAESERIVSSYDTSTCADSYAGPGAAAPAICKSEVDPTFADQIKAATACAEAIATNPDETDKVEAACGQPLTTFNASASAEATLHNALVTVRDQHDANYIGLDARYEFGDPTFSMKEEARGSHLLVGLAAGHRVLLTDDGASQRGFFGIKARAGYQMTSLNHNQDQTSSLDFAGGLEFGVIKHLQVFKLSIGAEGRHTWRDMPTNADTNFVDVKIGVDIPQTDGARLGALLSLPAEGSHGTTLSLVGNWSAVVAASAK